MAKNLCACITLLAGSLLLTNTTFAFEAGDIDPSFFTGVPAGTNDYIKITTLQPDDKILMADIL